MRRRISMFLAAALTAAGFVMLSPTQPATALVTCAGAGFADITEGGGILYPVTVNTPGKDGLLADILIGDLTTNPTYKFKFDFATAGTCVHVRSNGTVDPTDKASGSTGTVLGYCGLSSGRGFLNNGSLFAFVGVGGFLVITGHVVGLVNAVPDTLGGESCSHTGPPGSLPGAGALRFRVQGFIVLLNCTPSLQTLVPGTPDDFETLLPQVLTDVLTAGVPIHVKIHLSPHIYWNHLCVGSLILP